MANKTGKRGKSWTPAETTRLAQMVEAQTPAPIMARKLGRTISSIEGKIRLMRENETLGAQRGPGLPRYEAPEPIPSDCVAHLRLIQVSNKGRGFPRSDPWIVFKLGQAERPLPVRREFWRACA